jgi:hypothetical protein
LPRFVPQASGFRRAPVQITDLEEGVLSSTLRRLVID